MKNIKVIEIDICEQCRTKSCCFTDAKIKNSAYKLTSETTVCPVALLVDSPLQIIEEQTNIIKEPSCIDCNLCALSCKFANLQVVSKNDNSTNFDGLNDKQYNAIANSYLHHIFDFAANTNRNKAINFNGYCVTYSGEESFVEVDYNNDSLECVRRILSDILLYKPSERKVMNGIVVLKDLPRQGTHDVVNLLQKISTFPKTTDIKIYFSTFSILKYLATNLQSKQYNFSDLLLDITEENTEKYMKKIKYIISQQTTT